MRLAFEQLFELSFKVKTESQYLRSKQPKLTFETNVVQTDMELQALLMVEYTNNLIIGPGNA